MTLQNDVTGLTALFADGIISDYSFNFIVLLFPYLSTNSNSNLVKTPHVCVYVCALWRM